MSEGEREWIADLVTQAPIVAGARCCPAHGGSPLTLQDNGFPTCGKGCDPVSLLVLLGADPDRANAAVDAMWSRVLELQRDRVGFVADRFRFMSLDELALLPEPSWLIEGVLPDVGIAQLFGKTGDGKTFVALDLALRVATAANDWHGHHVVSPGDVGYVLMEGMHDWRRRINAWVLANRRSPERLLTLPEPELDLASKADVDDLVTAVADHDLSLLVVDTQALATPGTDENNNTDMGLVLSNLKRLSRDLRCLVMTVHHTGHEGSRARGASAQKAALDAEIHVADGAIKVTKVKSAPKPQTMRFVLEPSAQSVWARPVNLFEAILERQGDLDRRVVEAVRSAGDDGVTRTALYERVGGDKASCMQAIDRLAEQQVIVEAREGRARRYRLGATDASD